MAKFLTNASDATRWPNFLLMQVVSLFGWISNICMWCHLFSKFASYKVPPVMVSTQGSVVPLAMFKSLTGIFWRKWPKILKMLVTSEWQLLWRGVCFLHFFAPIALNGTCFGLHWITNTNQIQVYFGYVWIFVTLVPDLCIYCILYFSIRNFNILCQEQSCRKFINLASQPPSLGLKLGFDTGETFV